MSVQRIATSRQDAAPAAATRIFARKRTPLCPVTSKASYRLDNAGTMVGLMMSGVSDAVLADIYNIVLAERRRRAAVQA